MAYITSKGGRTFGDITYEDDSGANTKIDFDEDQIKFTVGGVDFLELTEVSNGQNVITFNQAGADIDLIIESPNESKAIYFHSGNEVLHINHGESNFQTKIHNDNDVVVTVNNTGVVFNEDSHANIDFRIESDGNAHLFFVDAGNDKIGIGTASPSVDLDVAGTAKAEYYITAPTATDLEDDASTTLTPVTSLHFLDASEVTLDSGKDYFEITLADGTTDGQHLQLAITTAANNPVKIMGDTGGDKAQGTVSFSGAPLNGQTVSFPNVGGSTTYVVTWDELEAVGNYAIPDATNITAGIGGAVSGNDMGFALYGALDTGISVSSWPFTLVGTYGGESTVTLSQTSAGTSGNQTITENSDNTTVTGFSGGTELVVGTINSTYGIALSNAAGEPQGAHLIYDSNSEQWQIIAGNALSS